MNLLNNILPKTKLKRLKSQEDWIFYTFFVEFKWSWDNFQQMPIPIILAVLKKQKEVVEQQKKANKK
jgi:hypothetical protein